MSKLVRVSDEVFSKLTYIAQRTGSSKQDVIDAALENWERDTLLKQANEAYAVAKNDNRQQKEELEEVSLWESTLGDGLEDE